MTTVSENQAQEHDAPLLTPLLAPADGLPPVVADERSLDEVARALESGHGPVAVDAERASGYRYGQRAYLVQLRRQGSGTHLVDPVACPDLSPLGDAIGDAEWVLHAATQDLPCLAQVGLRPRRLFDTELGARLAGRPRVGLAAVVAHYLGLALAKEHSAVDWSTRPLPEPWLRYAALDVEVLVDLRDAIATDLAGQDKSQWAQEEFETLARFEGPPRRADPWRRTSGMHKLRSRRSAALVRELWYARDRIARERDMAAGRVLGDAILLQLAMAAPTSAADLAKVSTNRAVRRYSASWLEACRRGLACPDSELPAHALPSDGPPPVRAWTDRDPVAAARLARARQLLAAFGAEHAVPVENLLAPDVLRRVLWTPPEADLDAVTSAVTALGARPWQAAIAGPMIVKAMLEPALRPTLPATATGDSVGGPGPSRAASPAATSAPDARPEEDRRRPATGTLRPDPGTGE